MNFSVDSLELDEVGRKEIDVETEKSSGWFHVICCGLARELY